MSAPLKSTPPAYPTLPLRVPRNRSACMWYLLDLVSRGSRYYFSGDIRSPDRIEGFVRKMHSRYEVLLSPSARTQRHKQGRVAAQLVLYPDWDGVCLWWLLLAGTDERVRTLAAGYNDRVWDAARGGENRLRFRDDYLLRTHQRTRRQGGGRGWTWYMAKHLARDTERELISLAAGHGRRRQRVDDLERAAMRARQRPMFHGVRSQSSQALRRAQVVWRKTHAAHDACPPCLTDPLPWFAGRMRIFD